VTEISEPGEVCALGLLFISWALTVGLRNRPEARRFSPGLVVAAGDEDEGSPLALGLAAWVAVEAPAPLDLIVCAVSAADTDPNEFDNSDESFCGADEESPAT
jgi:hypothetical protein